MMGGDSGPTIRRAIASLQCARTDLMALKRGSTVSEWDRLDRAMRLIDEAVAEAERFRDSRM